MKSAFTQANREAAVTLVLYVFFFAWWAAFAFIFGSGSPDDYSYICGFPEWFFYSCIVGYPVITLALWAALRLFFVDIPIDDTSEDKKLS